MKWSRARRFYKGRLFFRRAAGARRSLPRLEVKLRICLEIQLIIFFKTLAIKSAIVYHACSQLRSPGMALEVR